MYVCCACHKEYKNEEIAKECCTDDIYDEYGEFVRFSRKTSRGIPVARLHPCPNMNKAGKRWSTMLRVDEECPVCGYVYRPR